MAKLVCPNGHSETFSYLFGTTTLLSGARTIVDADGKYIGYFDPNTRTDTYRCNVCGAEFDVKTPPNWDMLNHLADSTSAEGE